MSEPTNTTPTISPSLKEWLRQHFGTDDPKLIAAQAAEADAKDLATLEHQVELDKEQLRKSADQLTKHIEETNKSIGQVQESTKQLMKSCAARDAKKEAIMERERKYQYIEGDVDVKVSVPVEEGTTEGTVGGTAEGTVEGKVRFSMNTTRTADSQQQSRLKPGRKIALARSRNFDTGSSIKSKESTAKRFDVYDPEISAMMTTDRSMSRISSR